MENRIAIAKFINGDKIAHTESIWQYDYGQELKLEGLDLPSAFEVHFAKELHGNAVTSLYNSGSALIPDQLIQTPGTLFAWVYLHDTESDGETEYTIVIDVKKRAKPSHETPTPAQQSEIEQLIATLETAVEESETNVTHYPKIEDGYWYVWDAVENDWSNTGVEATGPQGEQGPQGPEGPEGPEGPDGYSPSASVSKSGATATITITDKDGTTTASISDGAALIDDTATAQDSTWSSSKVSSELSDKMDKVNPTGSGALSLNRLAGSQVGNYSAAEGYWCEAEGRGSHAEGYRTAANGDSSHSEGYGSRASGQYSHAQNFETIAASAYQSASGKYNIPDYDDEYAEICGNGTGADARSNARTLDWNGNETLAGNLTIGGTPTDANHAARKQDVDAKQDQLTAGDGIDITSNVVSADVTNDIMNQAIKDAILSILPKKTVTGAVVSFSDAQGGYPLVNLEATIVPQQAPGTPTPTNPLPISGSSSGTITQTDGSSTIDAKTAQFGQTVYGGTWKASEGKVVPRGTVNLNTLNWNYDAVGKRWQVSFPSIKSFATRSTENMMAEEWKPNTGASAGNEYEFFSVGQGLYFYTTDSVNSPKGLFVYPLATPTEISVDAVNLTAQDGVNNIFADTGDSSVTYGAKIT